MSPGWANPGGSQVSGSVLALSPAGCLVRGPQYLRVPPPPKHPCVWCPWGCARSQGVRHGFHGPREVPRAPMVTKGTEQRCQLSPSHTGLWGPLWGFGGHRDISYCSQMGSRPGWSTRSPQRVRIHPISKSAQPRDFWGAGLEWVPTSWDTAQLLGTSNFGVHPPQGCSVGVPKPPAHRVPC